MVKKTETPPDLTAWEMRDEDLPELGATELRTLEDEIDRELEKEMKAEAKRRAKDRIRARKRQEKSIDEPIEEVVIDLPEYCNHILIDNVVYFQGTVRPVRQSVAILIREMTRRTWEHQSIVDGHRKDFYGKQKALTIGPAMSNSPASALTGSLLRA